MDPDQLRRRSRKRKTPVTLQSASPKRRGPDTTTIIKDIEDEEQFIMVPPVTLEGDTLGEKRRHFNKLVEDAVADNNYELRNINSDDSDIENLLKIEIASRKRNVDYIIEVMKSSDMLYAATAIKKSTWLITEPQYAHIINPEYLHTQLLPSMNTKTFNKLMLHIRLNLKDESRVEAFYEYLSRLHSESQIGQIERLETFESYSKWLENCSIPFIDDTANSEGILSIKLYKRLRKRSAHFVAYHQSVIEQFTDSDDELFIFFKPKTHLPHVLNKLDDFIYCPDLGKKNSEIIMKHYPKKVFDEFEKFHGNIDLSVVAKHINKKEIKSFLYEQTKDTKHFLWQYHNLGHFIKNMPVRKRFDFVKKIFINKTEPLSEDEKEIIYINRNIKCYQWYEFAPFNVALPELKKLIRDETVSSERSAMLSVLITCTGRIIKNIKSLLKYVYEKHINEPLEFKIQFVENLLSQVITHEFDIETWNVLDQLFHNIEVYTESETDVQMCLKSIVLYKVLHDEPVPKIVEEKLQFDTFEEFQSKLNQEQRSKMFTYLLNSELTKVQIKNIANESDFSDTIEQLQNALVVLRDWRKDICKYPSVLQIIQELIKMRQEKLWKTDMSCLYNVKKSWRKHMFEESLLLCLSEEACLNALKHKPQLLTRHDEQIDTLRTNDAVSLRRLLTKLRVYWPDSLAQHFTDAYLQHLNKAFGQKAVVKGLFMLLPQKKVINIAKKYVPADHKINWKETDRTKISIQKNIAKHLYIARPLVPLDTVLWYAKGDFLQHTVPSLNSILSQLNVAESRKYFPKLLDAPVSLQKFGLNLVVTKLKSDDLKTIFLKVWKSLTDHTIRAVMFKHTFEKTYYGSNGAIIKELWSILSTFIDDLTAEDSAKFYEIYSNRKYVPTNILEKLCKKGNDNLPANVN